MRERERQERRETAGRAPQGPGRRSGVAVAPKVVVVGAGVSGCACAAALAARGVGVTVLDSALDRVGMPGYGPEVVAGPGGAAEIAEAMAALPATLRHVWLAAAVAPDCEAGFFVVDRRMLSIETKRALERVPGLEFRQGLVVDLQIGSESGGPRRGKVDRTPRATLRTAFGESIEGEAIVLAVGLSLGGRVRVGEDMLPGGRYGETSADGLRVALEELGASFEEATVEVGPRFLRRRAETCEGGDDPTGDCEGQESIDRPQIDDDGRRRSRREMAGTVPLRKALTATEAGSCAGVGDGWKRGGGEEPVPSDSEVAWAAHYPPAPHWTDGLRTDFVLVGDAGEGSATPLASPDGVATGEVHFSPARGVSPAGGVSLAGGEGADSDMIGCAELGVRPESIASRLNHTVAGLAIANRGPDGRLVLEVEPLPFVWVAGRAGGARSYLESLRSGVRVAEAIVAALSEGEQTLSGASTRDAFDPRCERQ